MEMEEEVSPDPEVLVRGGGRIKFKENDEDRYLGPSSGIAMARLVMELARRNTLTGSIKEAVPALKAEEIRTAFDNEGEKPTSKIYPSISAVAAPDLPNPDLTQILVDSFMIKGKQSARINRTMP